MKAWLFLLSLLLPCIAPAETLVMLSSTHTPPKHFQEDGVCKGYAVDLGKAILSQAGFDPEVRCYPWRRAIVEGEDGHGIMVPAFSRSPEREALFLYSLPVHDDSVVIVQAAERPFTYHSPADLAGKRIGINRGATFTPEFNLQRPKMLINEDAGPEIRLRMLLADRIDAAIISGGSKAVRYNASKLKIPMKQLRILPKPMLVDHNYFAISRKHPQAEAIIQRVNMAIQRMKANGSLSRLLDEAESRY